MSLAIRLFQSLKAEGELVDRVIGEEGFRVKLAGLEAIVCEVAVIKVTGAVGLIVLAVVRLGGYS